MTTASGFCLFSGPLEERAIKRSQIYLISRGKFLALREIGNIEVDAAIVMLGTPNASNARTSRTV